MTLEFSGAMKSGSSPEEPSDVLMKWERWAEKHLGIHNKSVVVKWGTSQQWERGGSECVN